MKTIKNEQSLYLVQCLAHLHLQIQWSKSEQGSPSTTYLVMDVPCGVWFYLKHIRNNSPASTLVLALILTFSFVSTIATAKAETGKGDDVFRVIMTVFGADKSEGDIVAIVTVSNGEASKVKFLDTGTLSGSTLATSAPSTTNPAAGLGIIEYVATFPNVTVNAGDEYNACVMTTKDLEPICTAGNNSPANRPEFVDLSLNETSEIEQAIEQEENGEDKSNEESRN